MQRPLPEREAPIEAGTPVPGVDVFPVRARPPDTHLGAAFGALAVLVALAVLKPWGVGAPQATLRPIVVAPTAMEVTPVPTEDRSADGLASPICLGTGAWRIASLERWRTQDVRVWRAIEPIPGASGPLDPAIPAVPIVAVELTALGWCAPAFGDDRPVGPAIVTAWSVRGAVATELRLRQVRPVEGSTPIAALYVPLTVCPEATNCLPLLPSPAPRQWASERVVFHYADLAGTHDAWLAADIVILPGDVP